MTTVHTPSLLRSILLRLKHVSDSVASDPSDAYGSPAATVPGKTRYKLQNKTFVLTSE
jgi:hypothetical protein